MKRKIKTVHSSDKKKCQKNSIKQVKFLLLASDYLSAEKIAKKLKISKNSYYKTLKRYINKGWINEDRTLTSEGLALIKNCPLTLAESKSVHSMRPDTVRLHNLVFTVALPKKIREKWKNRREFLKLKHINFKAIGQNWSGERLIVNGIKVWLTPKSVVFYMPHYYGEDPDQVSNEATDDLTKRFIPEIEKIVKVSLKWTFGHKIKVSRQHYALIKNGLAKQYNLMGKKLHVNDEEGLWLLIDNSLNMHELETVRTGTARDDMKPVQDFFNVLKEHPTTSKELLDRMSITERNLQKASEINEETSTQIKHLAEGMEALFTIVKERLGK